MKPLAVDVVAQAIRTNPRTLAAGELAERYLRALYAAGYVVKDRETYTAANGEELPIGAAGTTIINDGRPT